MITVRPAQFSDHTAIARLHSDSWKRHYRGIFSDSFLDNDVDRYHADGWQQRLQSPDSWQRVFLAMQTDALVGFACFLLDEDPVFGNLLDNLHVSQQVQNKGIGKLLVREGINNIRSQSNTRALYLWVFEKNEPARRAYEKWGAVNVETLVSSQTDGSTPAVCRYIWNDIDIFINGKNEY